MTASGILLFLLAGAGPLQEDTAVDQAIRKFQSDYDRVGVRDEDRIQAVGALAVHRNEKVARVLAPLLTRSAVAVRIVVARHLAGFSGISGVDTDLLFALTHYRNTGQAARGVKITILQALGTLKASCAAEAVNDLIDNSDIWISKAAIEAAGKIRSASSMDKLIRLLVGLDGSNGDREVTLDLFEGALPATGTLQIIKQEADKKDKCKKNQRQVLREPLLTALTSITKNSFSGAKEWKEWWRTHKRKFTVPP